MNFYHLRTARGLYIANRPMKIREVLLNILMDVQVLTHVRYSSSDNHVIGDWKLWNEFSELKSEIEKIQRSPKVAYAYALGEYTPEEVSEYTSIRAYKGFLPLEEVLMLYAYHNQPKDRCYFLNPENSSWTSVHDFLNPKQEEWVDTALELEPNKPVRSFQNLFERLIHREGENKNYNIRTYTRVIKCFFKLLVSKLQLLKEQDKPAQIQFSKLGTFILSGQISERHINLHFRPCKALKKILKNEGTQAPQKLHFGGDRQPSKAALLWSVQRGTLSTRRQFISSIAQTLNYPVTSVSAYINTFLQEWGTAIARDSVVYLHRVLQLYTHWIEGYQAGAQHGKRQSIARHRRVRLLLHREFKIILVNEHVRRLAEKGEDSSYKKSIYSTKLIPNSLDLLHENKFDLLDIQEKYIDEQYKKTHKRDTSTYYEEAYKRRKASIAYHREALKIGLTSRAIAQNRDGGLSELLELGVRVEPGSFELRKSQEKVTLTRPIWVMKYLLPRCMYNFFDYEQCKKVWRLSPRSPVRSVSWEDAVTFCNELSIQLGLECCYSIEEEQVLFNYDANGFRLLTEAEWEYVAQAGQNTCYSGSDDYREVAICGDRYVKNGRWALDERYSPRRSAQPVGTRKPNAWGVYDMSGNLKEWCFDSTSKERTQEIDPVYNESDKRVLKGGSYLEVPERAQIGFKSVTFQYKQSFLYSFRIARNA